MDMIAAKRVKYPHGPTGKEYAPGEPFSALSDRDAKALFISGRATYGKPSNKTDLPKPAAAKEVVKEPAPLPQSYQTRHMTAETAGQTGEETSLQSSRRGRPPKVQTLPHYEDDAES